MHLVFLASTQCAASPDVVLDGKHRHTNTLVVFTMDNYQKFTLREWLLEQLLQEHQAIQPPGISLLARFKSSLRLLSDTYAVAILVSKLPEQQLVGRPLQLLITPRHPEAAAILIRVSGVLALSDESAPNLDFKPAAVDISSTRAGIQRSEFQHEDDSSQDIIGHLHHVLGVLSHSSQSSLALSA